LKVRASLLRSQPIRATVPIFLEGDVYFGRQRRASVLAALDRKGRCELVVVGLAQAQSPRFSSDVVLDEVIPADGVSNSVELGTHDLDVLTVGLLPKLSVQVDTRERDRRIDAVTSLPLALDILVTDIDPERTGTNVKRSLQAQLRLLGAGIRHKVHKTSQRHVVPSIHRERGSISGAREQTSRVEVIVDGPTSDALPTEPQRGTRADQVLHIDVSKRQREA